jgi:hypothetical protein
MSSQSIALNNGQQMIINTDTSKIFLWNNRYQNALYNNSAYGAVTLTAGTLMGRVAVTGWIKPLASGAADGSQFPCGILANDITVDGGALETVSICVAGDVAEEQVILQGTDTMETTISSIRLRQRIGADTVGINLVQRTDNSAYDNQ